MTTRPDPALASAATQLIPAWVDGRLAPVEKLEVHRSGLRHPAVSVFVMEGPRTLIQRRAPGKYHSPGLWANAVCTHPHWGEAPEACARRRLGEELGAAGLAPLPRDRIEYRAAVSGGDGGMVEHEVVDLFVAEAPPGLALAPDPAEVIALRWITLANLREEIATRPEAFTPWLRIYLSEHSHRIFGAAA